MENILNIRYQNRELRFQKDAYDEFLNYEASLKNYFSKEQSGDEIMHDLQNRMAEIFEDKLKNGAEAISMNDVEELKSNIGSPSEFDTAQEEETTEQQSRQTSTEESFSKKRLFRNKTKSERIIAGVCSGIANYFSIDPVMVRIIFVIMAIFNMATFFSFNLAILVYLILWVAVPAAYLKGNVQQKLFRNPKDKVVAGICSGLAQFFNTESWIIRTIFMMPVLIHIFSSHVPFHFHFMGTSLGGMMFLTYITLWVILPMAKSSTDYMLLKGEPINLSTIQNPASMKAVSQDARRGLNTVFKVLAYIFIAFAILVLIPTTFGFAVAGLFMVNIAKAILFTPMLQTFGMISFILFVSLPLISLIIWIIRRLAGYKKRSRPLRYIFSFLWIVAFFLGGYTIIQLGNDMKSMVSKTEMHPLSVPTSDTIYLKPMDSTTTSKQNVLFDMNDWNNVLSVKGDHFDVKAIGLHYESSSDSLVTVKVEKFAFGKNSEKAELNNDVYTFQPEMIGNTIYLPTHLTLPSNIPYRCQNVRVTVYIPNHKTLIVTKELRKKLKYRFRANHNEFNVSTSGTSKDKVIRFDENHHHITISTEDDDDETWSFDEDKTKKEEEKQKLRELKEEIRSTNREAKEQLNESKRQAEQQLEEAKRDAKLRIEEAERNLKQANEEAQRKLEEAQRKLDAK